MSEMNVLRFMSMEGQATLHHSEGFTVDIIKKELKCSVK